MQEWGCTGHSGFLRRNIQEARNLKWSVAAATKDGGNNGSDVIQEVIEEFAMQENELSARVE